MASTISIVSTNDGGSQVTDLDYQRDLETSPDGRYFAFLTRSQSLTNDIPVPKDGGDGYWFIKDTQTGNVSRIAAESFRPAGESNYSPNIFKYNYDVTLGNEFGVITYGSYAARFDVSSGKILNEINVPDPANSYTTAYTSGTSKFAVGSTQIFDVANGGVNDRFGEIDIIDSQTDSITQAKFPVITYPSKKDGDTSLSLTEVVRFSDASSDGQHLLIEITGILSRQSPSSTKMGGIAVDYGIYDKATGGFARLTNYISEASKSLSNNIKFLSDYFNVDLSSDLSDDGKTVVFSSPVGSLVGNDTNNKSDVFSINIATKAVSRISLQSSGAQLSGSSQFASVSGDGRYVVFTSDAAELGGYSDLYIRDMMTGVVKQVNKTIDGSDGSVNPTAPEISSDGKFIIFTSSTSSYVNNDANTYPDVFKASNPFLDTQSAAPTDVRLSSGWVNEFARTGTTLGTLSAVDADAGDTFTFKLLDNAGGRFALSGATLKVADGLALDYEQARSDTVTVQVTDSEGRSLVKTLALTVKDINPEKVTGSARAETFVGGAKGDTLTGGGGNDTLDGRLGKDTLKGDAGKDAFFFSTKPSSANLDHIKDFRAVDDTIKLENSGSGLFTKLTKGGLDDDALAFVKSGKDVVDDDVRILYDKGHGALYYDPNGGSAAGRVEFAVLDNHAALIWKDFLIV